MAQCIGRNQRTGERCKRSASGDASTCYYHSPAARQAKRVAPRRVAESKPTARKSGRTAFTTKELSKRTFEDFEALFAEGTGWGRCGCLFALDAPRSTRGGTWAEQREVNLCTMRGLVEKRRSQGSWSTTTAPRLAGVSSFRKTSCDSRTRPRQARRGL
jgi:hypothetical protein